MRGGGSGGPSRSSVKGGRRRESEGEEMLEEEARTGEAPSWIQFRRLEAVRRLLLLIKESGMFSLAELKRRMRSFIASRPELERPELGVSKPDGTFIKEMYSKRMCGHGVKALSEEDNILKPKVMGHLHTLSCATCGPRGEVVPNCYFYTM